MSVATIITSTESRTHSGGDDARSSKGNKNRQLVLVPNEIGGKENWTTGLSVETAEVIKAYQTDLSSLGLHSADQ
ncbi:hypothetical protein EMCRGX_G018268 [Ephydatia muelleri]